MSLKALAESLERKEILRPKLIKFLLAERRSMDAGTLREKEIVIQDARMTIRAFKARKNEYNHREEVEGQYFHPSAIGSCLRQLWFGALNAPVNENLRGDNILREYLIFEIGTYVHVMIQNLCERAGYLITREVAIMNPKLKTLGHADGVLKIGKRKYLLEIKTISGRQFAMLQAPKDSHVKQVHAYMKALELDCCIILYYDKDKGMIKEYVIEYDDSYYKEQVRDRANLFFVKVEKKVIPKKEGEFPTRFPCAYCAFSHICYDTISLKAWMDKKGARFPKKKKKEKKRETLYKKS